MLLGHVGENWQPSWYRLVFGALGGLSTKLIGFTFCARAATLVDGVVPSVGSIVLAGNRYFICATASSIVVVDLTDRTTVDSLLLLDDMVPTVFYPYFDYSDHLRIIVGCQSGAFFTV